MTNYYIKKDNKIVLFDKSKQKLLDTTTFMPQYAGLEILETERPIIDAQFADAEEFEARQKVKEKQTRILEIKSQLDDLDAQAIRPLRAILTDCATDEDREILQGIETQANTLRTQLNKLEE